MFFYMKVRGAGKVHCASLYGRSKRDSDNYHMTTSCFVKTANLTILHKSPTRILRADAINADAIEVTGG